jgi:hypothetical protein
VGISEHTEIMRELQIPQITEFREEHRRHWKEDVYKTCTDWIKKIIKYEPTRKMEFKKTSGMIEGFCFVKSVTHLSIPVAGRKDDHYNYIICSHI